MAGRPQEQRWENMKSTAQIVAELLAKKRELTETLQRKGVALKNEIREKTGQVKDGIHNVKQSAKEKATEYLVREALDRDEPRAMTKLVAAMERIIAGGNVMDAFAAAAKRAQEIPMERVELLSHDGELLVGHLYPAKEPKRIIIAVHGWRSSWQRDFGMFLDFWQRAECTVLLVEQRGQNESTGAYMGFGLMERYDCLDWVNWVMENVPGSLPIYLHGISMGAATVLMTTGFHLGGRVRGVIADCGFTSPDAIWMKVANENLHVSYQRISSIAKEICKQKINMGLDDYSTLEAMRVNETPVMFVHGGNDHFVPVEMTYENYKACKSMKKIFIVKEADHGMSYYCDPEGYERQMTDFFQKCD